MPSVSGAADEPTLASPRTAAATRCTVTGTRMGAVTSTPEPLAPDDGVEGFESLAAVARARAGAAVGFAAEPVGRCVARASPSTPTTTWWTLAGTWTGAVTWTPFVAWCVARGASDDALPVDAAARCVAPWPAGVDDDP